jgi:hypothetical protein
MPKNSLVIAAEKGDINAIEKYINEHPEFNINTPIFNGQSLLHIAVSYKQYAEAQFLVAHDANIHQVYGNIKVSDYIPSPLEMAAENGKMVAVLHGGESPSWIDNAADYITHLFG